MDNDFTTSSYITSTGSTTFQGVGYWDGSVASLSVTKEHGINPLLYFRYVKKKLKLGLLQDSRLRGRMNRVEKAFNEAIKNGQEALSEKLFRELIRETRESLMYAKGIRHFIDASTLNKHKNKIRGGHISDTKFADYTRVIPKNVLAKKAEVEDLFDGFVIYHYWNEGKQDVKQMAPAEKEKMRDPILFGVIKESSALYFIADWEDEYCDLTFDEIIDVVGGDDEDYMIGREPDLRIK